MSDIPANETNEKDEYVPTYYQGQMLKSSVQIGGTIQLAPYVNMTLDVFMGVATYEEESPAKTTERLNTAKEIARDVLGGILVEALETGVTKDPELAALIAEKLPANNRESLRTNPFAIWLIAGQVQNQLTGKPVEEIPVEELTYEDEDDVDFNQ